MDYFSAHTILVMGIIIGIAITLSFQMAWDEFRAQQSQSKRHTRRS